MKPLSPTDSVTGMSKLNYRVISDVIITPTRTMRVWAVLDTGTGQNFVRRGDLPSARVQISPRFIQTIND